MLITVAFLCGILTRLPTHADKFPDTCPCFPLYPPREFVKYFSLLSLFLSEYYRFIRTKLLHILSNALYFPFFLNSKIGNRSYSITFSCFSGRLVIVCESLRRRLSYSCKDIKLPVWTTETGTDHPSKRIAGTGGRCFCRMLRSVRLSASNSTLCRGSGAEKRKLCRKQQSGTKGVWV